MNPARASRWYGRRLRAIFRDTWLLFREFSWPLLGFLITMIGGGAIFYLLSLHSLDPRDGLWASIYEVLLLTFLQPLNNFPHNWYLGIFYFIMPVVGISFLAQGVAEFGTMFFNRKARGKEWETAVASTYNNHIILVGLGHLGYRVVHHLYDLDQDVVVVEANPSAELVAAVKQMGVPVIENDASKEVTLELAGVRRARAIVLCTQNDSLNLQVALKARRLNKTIQVVVRIFDDEFAQSLHDQFGFTAFSATNMAAPAFASAAAGVDMSSPITVEGETLNLARLKLVPASKLAELSVGEFEEQYDVSIVMLRRNNESDLHPAGREKLSEGDALVVLGGPAEIGVLVKNNAPAPRK